MLSTKQLLYGEWLPDQPALGNSCQTATNVIPLKNGYASVRALAQANDAIDSRCLSALSCRGSNGTIYTFVADAEKLYLQDVPNWTNVSKAGGYSATDWEFAKYGERIIAVPTLSAPQYYDLGTSAAFADLPGNPPLAKHVAVVRDFVVLGNLTEGGVDRTSKIAWSGFNNSEIWGSDIATQTDSQILLGDGGRIMRIVGGAYGVILQENSIWRMDYSGAPVIFTLNEVETERGTPASNSVCWLGRTIFYWGHDGFYRFDGQASIPIGNDRVDKYLRGDLDVSRIDYFIGVVDRANGIVFWQYPSLANGAQKLIVYNWKVNRWSLIDQTTEFVFQYFSAGYTLDSLDSILADIDSASISVDSQVYNGGQIYLGAFDGAHKLSTFSGGFLTATLETGDFTAPGRAVFLSKARALIESTGMNQIQYAGRDTLSQNVEYEAALSANEYGEFSVLRTARYARLRHSITGNSNHLIGLEIDYREAARRHLHVAG